MSCGAKLENLPEHPEPHARLDAPLRKIWSAPHVLRCAPEKIVEHPACVCCDAPLALLFLVLKAISSKSTYIY